MNGKLGSAAWQEPAETERGNQWKPGTVWLGRSPNGRSLGYGDDRHVTLVAGNRAGKGTSVIVPTLLTWPGSVMVIDPKGENATIAAGRRGRGARYQERMALLKRKPKPPRLKPSEWGLPPSWDAFATPPLTVNDFLTAPEPDIFADSSREENSVEEVIPGGDGLGQKVYVLDPFHVAKVDDSLRARFNPLDEIDPNGPNAIADSGLIADALVVIPENARDRFFDETARAMVKALIMHVLTWPAYEGRRNLTTVRQLALRGDWESAEALRDAGEETVPAQALLWQAVSMNTAFGGELAGNGDLFLGTLRNAPKTFDNALQSVNRNLEFMAEPQMQRVLGASDFGLADLKTDPKGVSVFLSLPQRYMNTHYRWLRMMIALTLARMAETPSPRGRPQMLMMLDEFAGLERMKEVEKAVAQTAGLGVKMFFVLQSLEQLKATYKDNWETFLANSGLKIFFNLGDHFSRDYVTKLIGETELSRPTTNSSNTNSKNDSTALGTSSTRTTSHSVAKGTSRTESESNSWSDSHTSGSSSGVNFGPPGPFGLFGGPVTGTTAGTFSSHTSSGGGSHSESTGSSETETAGESDAWGNSLTETRGKGSSRTDGTNETLHRRPLIHPDEIGRQFSSIGRENPAYPGLALILVEGRQPAPVRRANYYEDYEFRGLFDAHPDHPLPRLMRQSWGGGQVMRLLRKAEGRVSPGANLVRWTDDLDKAGPKPLPQRVARGEVLMFVPVFKADGKFDLPAVRAPRAGTLTQKAHSTDDRALFVMEYEDNGEAPLDPFAEVTATLAKVEQEKLRAIATGAVRVIDYSQPPAPAPPPKPRNWLLDLLQWYSDLWDRVAAWLGDVWSKMRN